MPRRNPSTGPRSSKRAFRLAAAALALVVSLAVAEIGLRALRFGEPRPDHYWLGPDLLPAPRPRGPTSFHRAHGVHYSVDATGYREAPTSAPAPEGSPRIAFLGDSFVFGIGVGDEDTLPEAVRRTLADRGRQVDVANWGIGGANAQQQAIVAEDRLSGAHPDVVVLVVLGNDADVMPWNPDPTTTCGQDTTRIQRAGRQLLSRVYLYRLATSALYPCQGPRRCTRGRFDNDWPLGRCFASSIATILDESEEAGATPLVVFYPQVTWGDRQGEHPEADKAAVVADLAAAAGAPFVSLIEAFAGQDQEEMSCIHPDGTLEGHPSPAGHRVAAEPIADALLDLLGEPEIRPGTRTPP